MRMYPEIARTVFDSVETQWPVTIEYQTSRVAVDEDGIYVSCFEDVYSRVVRIEQLRNNFRRLDLSGFAGLLDLEKVLKDSTGIATKVVDFEVRSVVDDQTFRAFRVGEKLYIDREALTKAGVEQSFRLADRVVELKREDREISIPLYLEGVEMPKRANRELDFAFLSRGTAWYPAKDVLQSLSIPYKWDGESKTLRINP